jgi:hypothetical protein
VKHLVQGSLGEDSSPAREARGAKLRLPKALECDGSGLALVGNQAQQRKGCSGPPLRGAPGGFGHDQRSVYTQERRSALGGNGGRAETTRYYQIGLRSPA